MEALPGKKLGILLSTPDTHPSVATVAGMCQAALCKGIEVYLYLIDEGVKNLRDQRLTSLSVQGMKLFVCAYGCQHHGVYTDNLDPGVTLCGLVILSNMIDGCDQFLAFN